MAASHGAKRKSEKHHGVNDSINKRNIISSNNGKYGEQSEKTIGSMASAAA